MVGNIYYAHYYDWQAHMRDHYLYQATPDLMLDPFNNITFVCRSCGVKHLREAMPFDRIVVTMALKTITRCGLNLYFEYYHLEPDGQRRKLAYGEQEVVCVRRNGDGLVTAMELPAPLTDHLNKVINLAN